MKFKFGEAMSEKDMVKLSLAALDYSGHLKREDTLEIVQLSKWKVTPKYGAKF